ncbi:MAG: hypothetical protein QW772_07195 [Zestosphaera sp.]
MVRVPIYVVINVSLASVTVAVKVWDGRVIVVGTRTVVVSGTIRVVVRVFVTVDVVGSIAV